MVVCACVWLYGRGRTCARRKGERRREKEERAVCRLLWGAACVCVCDCV